MGDYKYNPYIDDNIIPIDRHNVDEYTDSQYGKSFEQWLEDVQTVIVNFLVKENNEQEVFRLQGELRVLQTVKAFPELMLDLLKMKEEDKRIEMEEKKLEEKNK